MKSSSAVPGFRPDVALQGGDGGLVALDQLGDDRRIGLDRRRAAAGRRGGAGRLGRPGVVGERRDEVAAIEDRLQRVPHQRIALPHHLEEAGAARRRSQVRVTSTNSRPPASAMGRGVVICQNESPRGFMASVIIWP